MPDPYSREGEVRHSSIGFCLAMSDEEVCEMLFPIVPDRIERSIETARVYFHGAGYVEEANLRGKFMDWWNAWEAKQPKKPPFVFEEYLASIGIDPAEKDVLEFMMDDGTRRKYRIVHNGRTKPID